MSSANTIVVKLVEGATADELQLFPSALVESLAPDVDVADLQRLTAEARSADPNSEIADLSLFFAICFPDGVASDELDSAVAQLNQTSFVEAAARANDAQRAGVVPQNLQGYLDDSDTGLRINAVHNLPGGGGSGVQVLVVDDYDFDRKHPDFQRADGTCIVAALTAPAPTAVISSVNHSTAVLSVVQSVAPDVDLLYAGTKRPMGSADTADVFQAMVIAALQAKSSDVITCSLVWQPTLNMDIGNGAHMPEPAQVPMEHDFALVSLLRLLQSRGVTVAVAAGNGVVSTQTALDLDAHSEVQLRNTGAIVVGGLEPVYDLATPPPLFPPTSLKRWTSTTFGDRITCSTWADGFAAAQDSGSTPPYGNVNGTSFATPMIAAGVACLQAVALAKTGSALSPGGVVACLQDSSLGIDWAPGGGVGLFPQFDRIAAKVAN
jgi:hypothetical protein